MSAVRLRTQVSQSLTSKRGARIWLAFGVIVMVALFGLVGRAEAPSGASAAPANSESSRAAELLQQFPDADDHAVLLVAARADGADLSEADVAALRSLLPVVAAQTGHDASGPSLSEDGAAAVVVATITTAGDNTANAELIKELRTAIGSHPLGDLEVQVTGGPAFGADVAAAFDGADLTLLLVTITIVALLLILTYRSPVLWLVPLAVVAFTDQLATKATSALGGVWDLQFDTGIISVLVFGAGTNYALLLISRYREELARHDDHREALRVAWLATVPAIVASNVTVVLALLTLGLAVIPGTRGLGVASAVGLVMALAAVLLVLPPALAMCGRRVFWPFVPGPDTGRAPGRFWSSLASGVVRRPVVALAGGLALLGVLASGLIGTSVGLTQVEKFRVASESAAGLETLSAHFAPGEAQPIMIVTNTEAAADVIAAVGDVPGVVRAHRAGVSIDGSHTAVMVTGETAPGTPEALDLVSTLRELSHAVPGADALVGGAVAVDLDARAGNARDLQIVVPLVLAVSFVVLVLLLRSLVAPILLLLVNVASAAAAVGTGAWLGRVIFGYGALDLQVPLLSFLFLVALGIDYTIFLVHRARAETAEHGTRQGMVRAVTGTGGVITSAGIVLAAVFAALGVLPLVTLGQLGLIVGLGVIVDTVVVRSVIVPALFSLVGDRIWWPGRPFATKLREGTT